VRAEVEGLFERWRDGPIGEEAEIVIPLSGRQAIFSVRPWRDAQGDPGRPTSIEGVAVIRTLRIRRGDDGALVLLEDGRFAVTGDGLIAAGGPRRLFRYCRERIRRADDPASVAWWQEVAGVLSQRAMH
jgi:cell volume regulation protein A